MIFQISVSVGAAMSPLFAECAEDILVFGSDAICDIIIPSAPRHWFSFDPVIGKIYIIDALSDTKINDKPVASDGVMMFSTLKSSIIKSGIDVNLRELQVRISVVNTEKHFISNISQKLTKLNSGRFLTAMSLWLVVCFLAVILTWRVPFSVARTVAPEARVLNKTDTSASLASLSEPIPKRPPVVNQAALPLEAQVRHALIRMGVQSPVEIRKAADGLILSGTIAAQEIDAVSAVVRRVQADNQITVTNLTGATSKLPDIRIRAASSKPSFVVLDDGRRLLIGDRIRDDWQLASISAKEVIFKRGESTFRVPR